VKEEKVEEGKEEEGRAEGRGGRGGGGKEENISIFTSYLTQQMRSPLQNQSLNVAATWKYE
jgi:hypothetical protein